MPISWDLIRTFDAVAETGSLSAAARKLALTQPTVGRHIDLLEEQLRNRLFLRSRDGMQLTEKGADLVPEAKNMVASANGFSRIATGLEEDISGTVRLSANEIFGVLILPHLLPQFLSSHPGIEIELSVTNTATDLLQRDADVAIRMFAPRQSDLIARKIAELKLGFYAHRNYLKNRGQPASLHDLLEHQIIGFDRETSLIEVAKLMGLNLTPSNFAFRCDNILAHTEAIRSGLGVGITHIGLAERWSGVDQLLSSVALPPLEVWLVCHADVRHNKRIRHVMDFLSEHLKTPYLHYNPH